MIKILIRLVVIVLRFINLFFRPVSTKSKVTIISRQADEPTLDIRLLDDCLQRNGIKTAVLTKTLKKTPAGAASYCIQLLRQMYHIASSRVVVIDGYCILVSVLPKKKDQKVIQMWHALGAIKKFGWQNIDNPDGHGKMVSEAMSMHRNYDYVLTPGSVTGGFFAEAFKISEDKLVYCGLPRIDFLRDTSAEAEAVKLRMKTDYPEISSKINVLYVPTFRKNAELGLEKLVYGVDFSKFNLIIKKHFLDKGDYTWAEKAGAIVDDDYSSMEWLRICEKVVTDYSAIAFEAAVLDREIYIYQPDSEMYEHNVGLNVDMHKEAIGDYVCVSEKELFNKMSIPYDKDAVAAFRNKYIEIPLDNCTQQLCDFISELLVM